MISDSQEHNEKNGQDIDIPVLQVEAQAAAPENDSRNAQKKKIYTFKKRFSRKELLDVFFSGVVALATIVSTFVAVNTRQATQRQIRPYVLSKAEIIAPVVGEPVRVKYTVVNYGQSPALNTRVVSSVFYGRDAMSQAVHWMKETESSIAKKGAGSIIPPGASAADAEGRIFFAKSKSVTTERDMSRIAEQDGLIVTVSRYVYQDSFGDIYGTQNCYTFSKTGEAQDCPGYNEIYGPN